MGPGSEQLLAHRLEQAMDDALGARIAMMYARHAVAADNPYAAATERKARRAAREFARALGRLEALVDLGNAWRTHLATKETS